MPETTLEQSQNLKKEEQKQPERRIKRTPGVKNLEGTQALKDVRNGRQEESRPIVNAMRAGVKPIGDACFKVRGQRHKDLTVVSDAAAGVREAMASAPAVESAWKAFVDAVIHACQEISGAGTIPISEEILEGIEREKGVIEERKVEMSKVRSEVYKAKRAKNFITRGYHGARARKIMKHIPEENLKHWLDMKDLYKKEVDEETMPFIRPINDAWAEFASVMDCETSWKVETITDVPFELKCVLPMARVDPRVSVG